MELKHILNGKEKMVSQNLFLWSKEVNGDIRYDVPYSKQVLAFRKKVKSADRAIVNFRSIG